MIKRVAITGIAGYLGSHLAREFERDPNVECIFGLDLEPPPPQLSEQLSKLIFIQHDVGEPFGGWFLEHWIDTAVHLAFRANAYQDRATDKRTNIQGTECFLEACHRAGIPRILVASCASVYRLPAPTARALTEDAPLHGANDLSIVTDKIAQEAKCREFEADHPEVCLIRARLATILGPGASHPVARALLRRPLVLPRRMNAVQFCHVEDAARAVHFLLEAQARGVFNIGPDDRLKPKDIGRVMSRHPIRVPRRFLYAISGLGQRPRTSFLATPPPDALLHLGWPSPLSSRRLQQEYDFRFKFSSQQALRALATSPDDAGVT